MRAKEFIIEAIPLDQLRSVSGKETQANKDIIDRLKKSMPSKPRNFVAKNAKMGGAGQHKDKKKAEKQGDFKHKQQTVPMESTLSELSTDKLAQYKKAAYADAKQSDADGKYARGDKRFSGINKATSKQFDNDLKKHGQKDVAEGESQHSDMSIAQDVYAENPNLDSEDDILNAAFPHVVKMMGGNKKRANYMFNYDEDFPGEMIGAYKWLQRQAHDVGEDITMERDRDPEDWDEGNTEPPNNFAVYINGKKWKVFAGRGTYADDYREKAHYQQLRAWADKKSAATGKKWTVSPTGEPATA